MVAFSKHFTFSWSLSCPQSGYVLRSNIGIPYERVHPIVTPRVNIFINQPALNISSVEIPDISYAIALGAVETGNINVKEHAYVGASTKYKGLIQS